ncbi:MAG: ketoacyl-ACP synthase III [Alphaproteobacteria bacterium]|nr:ketoacyl-ACP synthase III [Alphaproteobacteria bacterium]
MLNNTVYSAISSIASYLPEKILTNDDLSKIVDTNNEWIVSRTGIERRHIVTNEKNYDLAFKSSLLTLEKEGISAKDIDCIIVATITSANKSPSTANKVQALLEASNAYAFDVQAACSGFIYGLNVADSFIRSGKANTILLIGSDAMSLVTDWTDRSTCVLLGDGAGSCIVKKSNNENHRIIDINLYSDGNKYNQIVVHNSEKNNYMGHMTMNGPEVFKSAIKCMSESMNIILNKNNMTIDDVDWIVPHQANARIIKSLCEMNGYPLDKAIISIQEHANTSSATIPLALDYGINNNKIKQGDTILLTAMGAGLTWGAALLRY